MRETNEFALEWVIGDKIATVTVPEGTKMNNRIKELKEKFPDQVEECNSELFHIPVSWIKINPTRQMSDERREALSNRMRALKQNS
jgi:peptidoglycan hydrolase CwlO-like protein